MAYRLQIIILFHLLVAANLCTAMENDLSKKNYMQLTAVKKPEQAIYLTDKRIAMRHQNGCSIIDPITNTEVLKITDQQCQLLEVHPKKELLALAHGKNLTIYNTTSGKEMWSTSGDSYIVSAIFNPYHEIIFLKYHGIRYGDGWDDSNDTVIQHHYINGQTKPIGLWNYPIAFNPAKEIMYTLGSEFDQHIWAHQLDNSSFTNPQKIDFKMNIDSFKCSPDGSVLATDSSQEICLFSNTKMQIMGSLQPPTSAPSANERFKTTQFNPKSSILAVLSQDENNYLFLYYYDIATQQHIHTIVFPKVMSEISLFSFVPHAISFSPDGAHIIIIANKKCIKMPLPFRVLYQGDTKKNFPYLLFLLKNLNHDQSYALPQDLMPLLKYYLLETFRR